MNLIYSSMTVHNDAGTETEVKVLLALYDETAGKLTTAVDLLNDNGTLKQFTYTGYSFGFAKFAEIPNPLIIITGAIPNDVTSLNINSFYNSVVSRMNGASKVPPEVAQQFIRVLVSKGLSEKVANLAILCCYARLSLTTKDQNFLPNVEVSLIAPEFEQQTKTWINETNRKNTMAAIPNNETKFQESCEDELFIKLPAYEAMFNYLSSEDEDAEQVEVRDLHNFMPARDEVSKPYGSNATTFEDPDSVQKMLDTGGAAYESILKTVVGDPSNNTDELFDNEKRYYDALNTWMGFIAESEDPAHGDRGDLCSLSLEYLHALVETLYIWYWQHNKRVPCKVEIGSGDNADESRYTFKSDDHLGVAPDDLIQFLDRVAADLGREAYAKAVIQLARWGSRKPDAIVFDGYEKCFDLNIGRVKNSAPSLAKFDKVQSNGCDFHFVGVIHDTTNIADPRIGFKQWPMPVGVALCQVFCDKTNGNTIELMSFYSMIDIVKEVILGHISVDGLSYSQSDGWRVAESACDYTMDEVISISKTPDRMQFPIFRGTGLIQIYTDLRIPASSNMDSQFSIMCAKALSSKLLSFIDNNSFDTYATFDALTKNGKPGRKQAVDYMIVRDLLKVYHEVAVRFEAQPISENADIVDLWYKCILDVGYVDEAYFYKGVTKPSEPLPGCKVENFHKCFWNPDTQADAVATAATANVQTTSPQQMNFAQTNMQSVTSVPTSSAPTSASGAADFRSAIIEQPAANCEYASFVNDAGGVVCTCAINPGFHVVNGIKKPYPMFVVLDKQTCDKMDLSQIQTKQPVAKLLVHMCKAFYALSMNKPMNSNLRFINSDAIREMHIYFKRQL